MQQFSLKIFIQLGKHTLDSKIFYPTRTTQKSRSDRRGKEWGAT